MKNIASATLLLITITFAAFIGGFFVGRITDKPQSNPLVQQSTTAPNESQATDGSVGDQTIAEGKLNINLATAEELMLLPGIGEVLAQRILEYWETNGAFSSVEDLLNVSGIGAARFNAITKYLTIGG